MITKEQLQATVDSEFAYKHKREAHELIQALYRQMGNAVAWAEDIQKRVVDPIVGIDTNLTAAIAVQTAFFEEVIAPTWAKMNDPKFANLVGFVPNERATYPPPPQPTPEELARQAVAEAQNALNEAQEADVPDQATIGTLTAALAEAQAALAALVGGAS